MVHFLWKYTWKLEKCALLCFVFVPVSTFFFRFISGRYTHYTTQNETSWSCFSREMANIFSVYTKIQYNTPENETNKKQQQKNMFRRKKKEHAFRISSRAFSFLIIHISMLFFWHNISSPKPLFKIIVTGLMWYTLP